MRDQPEVGTYRHHADEHGLPVAGVRAVPEVAFWIPDDNAIAEVRVRAEVDVGDRAALVHRLRCHLDHPGKIGRHHRWHEDLIVSDCHTRKRLGAAGRGAIVGRQHENCDGQKCRDSEGHDRPKPTRNV